LELVFETGFENGQILLVYGSHLKVLSSSKQIMFHKKTRQTFSKTIQGEKVIQA